MKTLGRVSSASSSLFKEDPFYIGGKIFTSLTNILCFFFFFNFKNENALQKLGFKKNNYKHKLNEKKKQIKKRKYK